MLDKIRFKSIIDVGCGDGFLCKKIKESFSSADVWGVDYSSQAIRLAELMNRDNHINFLQSDILLQLPKETFDVAVSVQVLEHIPPDLLEGFIESIATLINNNGYLLISVPTPVLPVKNISKHYQHFTLDKLTELLKQGFEIYEYSYSVKRYTLTARIIKKILSNRLFVLQNTRLCRLFFQIYLKNCRTADQSNGTILTILCKKVM